MGICLETSENKSNAEKLEASGEISLGYSRYGVCIGLETTLALSRYLPTGLIPGAAIEALDTARVVFSFVQTKSPDGQRLFTVLENGIEVFSSPDVGLAAHALESQAHQFVAMTAQEVVFVHAGVVSWRGKAVLVPGRSYSGKSTLVMALVNAGATYYSDEYAVLDLEGSVHAFPRSPRLRPDVVNASTVSTSTTPSEGASLCPLPANSASLCPLPIGLVLKTRYNPVATWRPQSLTPGETLLALLENTVAVRSQSELSIRTLKHAVISATGLQSERANAAETAQAILQLLDARWNAGTPVLAMPAKKDTYE